VVSNQLTMTGDKQQNCLGGNFVEFMCKIFAICMLGHLLAHLLVRGILLQFISFSLNKRNKLKLNKL
jgi:hypothetical protein